MDTHYLPLAQAIGELRTELLAAVEQAGGEDLKFAVNTIELELQVVATTAVKGEVRGSVWGVVTVKSAGEHTRAATHKVKLVLEPKSSTPGEGVYVSDAVDGRPK